MSKIIKVNPPYKPLVQLYECCGPCAFQWILHRRDFWIDQEELAWHCKLKILKKNAKYFVRNMRITKSRKDTGTSVEKMHIYLNKMLKDKKIPLTVEKHPISKIKDPKEFMIENLKKENDIMLDFFCKPFPVYEYEGGHVCVVSEFNSDKEIITLGDPAGELPKFWKVPLKKIIKSMDKKYDGHERGFWIVKSKRKK